MDCQLYNIEDVGKLENMPDLTMGQVDKLRMRITNKSSSTNRLKTMLTFVHHRALSDLFL